MHQVLEPLGYHRELARRLEQLEPASWAAFALLTGGTPVAEPPSGAPGGGGLFRELARTSHLLEQGAHARVHGAARRAASALEVTAPLVLYQVHGSHSASAELHHLPGQAVLTFSGSLLTLLDDDELCAVIGHELAHRLLWTRDGGRYLIAHRLLDALAPDARTPPAYLESARRWALATELYADRGALRACGDLAIAVSALAKLATGLGVVDAAAYLRQPTTAAPDHGGPHGTPPEAPEAMLRAWALQCWHVEESDRAAHLLLSPGLDLDRLDLIDQSRLEALTRTLVTDAVTDPVLAGAAATAHARQFFPDVEPGAPATAADADAAGSAEPDGVRPGAVQPGRAVATRRYLAYVLLDFATIDPDTGEAGVLAALRLAERHGVIDELREALAREGVGGRRVLATLPAGGGAA